jgi:hypothetical protein
MGVSSLTPTAVRVPAAAVPVVAAAVVPVVPRIVAVAAQVPEAPAARRRGRGAVPGPAKRTRQTRGPATAAATAARVGAEVREPPAAVAPA